MNCPSCSHDNRTGARFCEACATPLEVVCRSCGAELRATARFCDACATPVAGSAPLSATAPVPGTGSGARKVVTILFADLAGSTALHERLDPESTRRFMERYYATARAAVEGHGGAVTQLLGDGVKAVFGVPRVSEDDALRAVRAAVAMQESFHALAEAQRFAVGETGLRVAVNTGEVVAKDETEIIGDPVNVAARLQEQGRDGDVVIGESTEQLVGAKVTLEALGSFSLKGRAEPVKAYRVVSLDAPDSRTTTEFVGREAELARMADVYDAAMGDPAASLAVVLGSAGLGKSRLIDEFERRVGDAATIVHVDCEEAGGASFAPLAGALRELLGLDADAESEAVRAAMGAALPEDDERDRIADGIAALIAARPALPEETFFVVRRLLAGLAARRPVVLAIDDLQWAEPLLLDLVEHLVEWGSGVPLLLLIGARPELRDVRSSLAQPGGLVSQVLTLTGLDASAATRLAANAIGASDLPAAVAAKVLAASEGNPLFVGELVRMLVHVGALAQEGDRWTTGAALAALEMPPTIHALLAARIERLDPAERTVLEHASIVGRTFSRSAVAELLPGDGPGLDAELEALQRSELIERDSGWFLGEPVLRFHHVLIRDAAYGRILKGTRADLHARFGGWVEAQAGESALHDETIGWHFEQAHVYLGELGPLDQAGRELGERASKHLAAAGRRALERDDVPLAASLLGRSLSCLDADDPARAELALDWCEALLAAGDVGAGAEAIDEFGRLTEDSDRLRAWHTCFEGQLTVLTAPEALDATADVVAEAARTLAALGDAAGEAKAHYVYALALQRLGRVGACEAALDRALVAARRVDDRRRANTVLAIAPLAALWGPSPVTRASGRCLDVVRVLRITQGAPTVEAVALSCQGVLEALRGRTEAARRMIASAREMVEELGITHRLLEAHVFAGRVELLEGDAPAAERWLRPAYEGLRDGGLGIDAAQAAALLARALLAQDRVEEAEALSYESESLAGDDLTAAIAWRGARAEALARRGEHAGAVEFASKGVEIASATDALLDHAEARLALAAALRAAGRDREADAEEARANELWEAKGATRLGERSPGRLADASSEEPLPRAELRRVRPNRATAWLEQFAAAIDSRDAAAVDAWFPDESITVEHATGIALGGVEQRVTWSAVIGADELSHRIELLASLGESLALARQRLLISGQRGRGYESFGEAEIEKIVLQEKHPARVPRTEIFASDRMGAAVARMYALYAEEPSQGSHRTRAEETARSIRELLGDFDFDRFKTRFAPDVEVVDHRTIGFGSFRGAERLVEAIDALLALTDEWENPVNDVLGATEHVLLLHWTNSGTDRSSGGRFEGPLLEVWVFGDDGLLARWERFEPGHEADALARFDALAGGGSAAPDARFENLATRFRHPIIERLRDGDLEELRRRLADDLRVHDRRRVAQIELDRAGWVEMVGQMHDLDSRRLSIVPLATRGARLALWQSKLEVTGGDVGPSEIRALSVVETDQRGERAVFWARFDPDDVDAAFAELDARYEAGEAAAHSQSWACIRGFIQGVGRSDWEAVAALCADVFVEYDHRSVATLGTTRSGAEWARNFRTLAEMAPGTAYRVDHFLPTQGGFLTVGGWRGTREGGPYEIPLHAVIALDAHGKIARADIYDDVDAALARLAETGAPRTSPEPFANAATRAFERGTDAFAARDWEAFAALFAADFRSVDRHHHRESGRQEWLAALREMLELTASPSRDVLATRGDRLALVRHLWRGTEGDVGPSEVEWLMIIEVDERGDHKTVVSFDPNDLDAAFAELDARFEAGEGGAYSRVREAIGARQRALEGHDGAAFAASAAPGFVQRDHRKLVWASEARDIEEFAALSQSLRQLAPETSVRIDHERLCARGSLRHLTYRGTTREGAVFENVVIMVNELDEQGRFVVTDCYDSDDPGPALARFEELRRDPPWIPPNAAVKTLARWWHLVESGRPDEVAALYAPGYTSEDRRSHARIAYDVEGEIFDARWLHEGGWRFERTLLATAGDRLSLQQLSWTAAEPGADSQIDALHVQEVDDEGRFLRVVLFDPQDRASAGTELFERAVALGEIPLPLARYMRAWNDHDLERVRLLVPEYFDDHRRTGVGRLAADAYVESLRALFELSADVRLGTLHRVAAAPHGVLMVNHWLGSNAEGGEVEAVFVSLVRIEADRIAGVELFELDALERARARFAALVASTSRAT